MSKQNEIKPDSNPNSKKVSYKVSLGGIVAALCLLMMFMTTVFPVLDMALPLFAGMLITVVAVEVSPSWALVTYVTVSLLSFFITPDKSAAIIFAAYFGYYPILRIYLEKFRLKVIAWLIKFASFCVSMVIIYELLIKLFGTVDLIEEFGFLKEYMVPVLLAGGVLIFLLYDYTLGLTNLCYLKWFRPTFLRKFK